MRTMRTTADEEHACLEHVDAPSSAGEYDSSEGDSEERPRWRIAMGAFLGGAFIALTVLAVMTHNGGLAPPKANVASSRPPSVSRLLMDPELHQVATDQICPTGHTCDASDLTSSMRSHLTHIRENHAELAKELDAVEVTPRQRDIVLAAVKHVNDPRVHALGMQIGRVVNLHAPEGLGAVNSQVSRNLAQSQSVKALRQEIAPDVRGRPLDGSVIAVAGRIGNWNASLSITLPERRLFTGNSSKWTVGVETAQGVSAGIFAIVYAVLHHTGTVHMESMTKGISAASVGYSALSKCWQAGYAAADDSENEEKKLYSAYMANCVWDLLVLVVDCVLMFIEPSGGGGP